MSSKTFSVIFVGLCVIWPVVSIIWAQWRGQAVLKRWLAQNSYQLVRRGSRPVGKGRSPFFWTMSLNQTVYDIEVLTAEGERRTGWLRIGNALLGPVTDRVDVRWDS